MGREFREVKIAMTVDKPERLPNGWYADDVVAKMRRDLQPWLDQWVKDNPGLLSCEPDIW